MCVCVCLLYKISTLHFSAKKKEVSAFEARHMFYKSNTGKRVHSFFYILQAFV